MHWRQHCPIRLTLFFLLVLTLHSMVLTRSGAGIRVVSGLVTRSTTRTTTTTTTRTRTPLAATTIQNEPKRSRKISPSKAVSKNVESEIIPKKRRLNSTVSSSSSSSSAAATAATALVIPAKTASKETDKKDERNCILSLPDDVVIGELCCRPSKRNRSPYVADVLVASEDGKKREAIVHVPNLDMGGKCVPGCKLLLKPARDKKGNLVGGNAVNPKYGTPKCEFIAQLLKVDESALGYEETWVGAHPSLGEKIAEQLVSRNLLGPDFPKVKSFKREVRNIGGADMRADFLIEHEDPALPPRIMEVKTVVDTDYSISAVPERHKCVFTSDEVPYQRTAIFPWGQSNQKGPDGETVVSARAIKHVRELTRLVEENGDDGTKYDATILFVIIRDDAKAFRPNHEACPSFAKYLKQAENAGVQILAKQVSWGEGENLGKCYESDLLEVKWPKEISS